jgi:hypothetical protein
MIQRRGGPRFSREDEERLLAFMQVTRDLNNYYGAASVFDSPEHVLSSALQSAIDKLGEHISGVPRIFLPPHSTAGAQQANPEASRAREVRQLLWRELRVKYR